MSYLISLQIPIGICRQRPERYLKEYKNVTYTTLLISGKLNSCFAEIKEQARGRLETLIEQMKQAQGITEQQRKISAVFLANQSKTTLFNSPFVKILNSRFFN